MKSEKQNIHFDIVINGAKLHVYMGVCAIIYEV